MNRKLLFYIITVMTVYGCNYSSHEYLLLNSEEKNLGKPPIVNDSIINKKIATLILNQDIVIKQIKTIDSLSNGERKISLITILEDSIKNFYRVKVCEDNGFNYVTYFNYLVDAKTMKIIESSSYMDDE